MLNSEIVVVLQLAVFPLIGALWLSITKRIDRLEHKVDRMPTTDLCQTRHSVADSRMIRLEKKVFNGPSA